MTPGQGGKAIGATAAIAASIAMWLSSSIARAAQWELLQRPTGTAARLRLAQTISGAPSEITEVVLGCSQNGIPVLSFALRETPVQDHVSIQLIEQIHPGQKKLPYISLNDLPSFAPKLYKASLDDLAAQGFLTGRWAAISYLSTHNLAEEGWRTAPASALSPCVPRKR
jgi:hypothetical protein